MSVSDFVKPVELPVPSDSVPIATPIATVPVIIPSVPVRSPDLLPSDPVSTDVPAAPFHLDEFPHDLVSLGNRSAILVPVSIAKLSLIADRQ